MKAVKNIINVVPIMLLVCCIPLNLSGQTFTGDQKNQTNTFITELHYSSKKWFLPFYSLPDGDFKVGQSQYNFSNVKMRLPSLQHTAFFCRIESYTAKHTKIPFLFRIGDVDVIEQTEGKRKSIGKYPHR